MKIAWLQYLILLAASLLPADQRASGLPGSGPNFGTFRRASATRFCLGMHSRTPFGSDGTPPARQSSWSPRAPASRSWRRSRRSSAPLGSPSSSRGPAWGAYFTLRIRPRLPLTAAPVC